MNSEGAHAAHKERQAHVNHVGQGEEWDDCERYAYLHSFLLIRKKLRQLISEKVKRERNHQSETESLEKGHNSESLRLRNVIRANLVTDKNAGSLLDSEADRVAQGRDLHRDHHVSLSHDTKIARHDS